MVLDNSQKCKIMILDSSIISRSGPRQQLKVCLHNHESFINCDLKIIVYGKAEKKEIKQRTKETD